ncbi:FTR1 family protein [Bacillus smithii]|uniref:FTR1 family protein n=1 Tax=Bacillus smithii TaxID=1479 RepID=UPI0030C9EFDB
MKRSHIIIVMIGILVCFLKISPVYAEKGYDELYVPIGDALTHTQSADWDVIQKDIQQFEQEWNTLQKPSGKQVNQINQELETAKKALHEKNAGDLRHALSALSSQLILLEEQQSKGNKGEEKEKVRQLQPMMEQMKTLIESKKWEQAYNQYRQFETVWTREAEKVVRQQSVASYGEIEKNMAFLRIALTQEPVDQKKASDSLQSLKQSVDDFLSGKASAKTNSKEYTLSDLNRLLKDSVQAIQKEDKSKAVSSLNEVLTIWPMVEGEVQTRDAALYNDMETKVPAAVSILSSNSGDAHEAEAIINDLHSRLESLTKQTSYSIWDAALILLREGMEALLVIVALVAFLKKTNQVEKQKWIWGGAGAGILASVLFAVVLSLAFSKMTGASSREYIEGFAGIVAVVMMLTVGAWLHNKSNVRQWNRYIQQQMNQALEGGRLWMMSLISFLAIFREGAETIIFYVGMAPSMSVGRLVTGIGIALVILFIVGFLIIHFSVKIPVRPFFLAATVLIYFLSFKILGVSVHALQVAKLLPAHTLTSLPNIDWIGFYPTLETILPQIVLVVLIAGAAYWVEKSNRKNEKAA